MSTFRLRRFAGDLEQPFGRIFVLTTGFSSVALEVAGNGLRSIADFAKIKSLTSHGEEEHTIESLEQNGRGLVDGAEDSLAVVGKLSQKSADRPSSLTV